MPDRYFDEIELGQKWVDERTDDHRGRHRQLCLSEW